MSSLGPMMWWRLLTLVMTVTMYGCGPSAAQIWSDLPKEERQRRVAGNLKSAEIHVSTSEEEFQATDVISVGQSFWVFGEIRFKDPKASRPGTQLIQLWRRKEDGEKVLRDQTTESNLKETQPGIFSFSAQLPSIGEPGPYAVGVKGLGEPFAICEFRIR